MNGRLSIDRRQQHDRGLGVNVNIILRFHQCFIDSKCIGHGPCARLLQMID